MRPHPDHSVPNETFVVIAKHLADITGSFVDIAGDFVDITGSLVDITEGFVVINKCSSDNAEKNVEITFP